MLKVEIRGIQNYFQISEFRFQPFLLSVVFMLKLHSYS